MSNASSTGANNPQDSMPGQTKSLSLLSNFNVCDFTFKSPYITFLLFISFEFYMDVKFFIDKVAELFIDATDVI